MKVELPVLPDAELVRMMTDGDHLEVVDAKLLNPNVEGVIVPAKPSMLVAVSVTPTD